MKSPYSRLVLIVLATVLLAGQRERVDSRDGGGPSLVHVEEFVQEWFASQAHVIADRGNVHLYRSSSFEPDGAAPSGEPVVELSALGENQFESDLGVTLISLP